MKSKTMSFQQLENISTICLILLFTFNLQATEPKSLKFVERINNNTQFSLFESSYYTIKSISVNEITSSNTVVEKSNDNKIFVSMLWDEKIKLGEIIMQANKLLAFGQKVWQIIKAGKPVVNTNFMASISVLPRTEKKDTVFYEMENWKMPKVKKYRVVFKNLFGSSVIDFVYNVAFQYGGSFEGKGSYIAGVTLYASNINVSWGFKLNSNSQLINISNMGSLDNPTATATLKLDYQAESIMKTISASETFFISGNGKVVKY